jgi:hypothetical protein
VADLCAGVGVTGKSLVSFKSLAKPAVYQAVQDPDFGTTIRRITDVATQWPGNDTVVPVYPTIPAWNADESYLFLYIPGKGWPLLDGKNYKFIRMLDINPADVEQVYWDMKDPDLLYYVDNAQTSGGKIAFAKLTRFHVSTGAKEVIHDFALDIAPGGVLASACSNGLSISGGEDPFFMSFNNDLIGLGCALPKNGPNGSSMFAGFTYRISTGQIGSTISNEGHVPQAMPLGKSTYFYKDLTSIEVLNPVTQAVKLTVPFSGEEHSDLLINASGQEVIAGAQFDGPSGSGTLMVANLATGKVKTIIGEANGDPYPPGGTLISGRAIQAPGWVAVGIIGDPKFSLNPHGTDYSQTGTYLNQEIILANVDTGKFCRVAHNRTFGATSNSSNSNYWAQPNVTLSPSGTRVLFQSDWGGGGTIDTYVLEFPGYKP